MTLIDDIRKRTWFMGQAPRAAAWSLIFLVSGHTDRYRSQVLMPMECSFSSIVIAGCGYYTNHSSRVHLRWTPKFGQVAKRESRS